MTLRPLNLLLALAFLVGAQLACCCRASAIQDLSADLGALLQPPVHSGCCKPSQAPEPDDQAPKKGSCESCADCSMIAALTDQAPNVRDARPAQVIMAAAPDVFVSVVAPVVGLPTPREGGKPPDTLLRLGCALLL